jgi:malate dehydrogenase
MALHEGISDILLIDIIPNLPAGEALDLGHAATILGLDVQIRGSNDYSDMAGSEIVVVTAGFPRKPGMTREELVSKNAGIIRDIAENIRRYAPESIVILTTNPLEAMTYLMYRRLGFPRERVIGFSGVLDSGRMAYYIARRLGVAASSISPVVIGQHGEKMLPLPRLTSIYGSPLTNLLSDEEIEKIVEETVQAGATITKLRGYSSNFGPGAGVAKMVTAILKDQKRAFLATVYLDGEYGVKDLTACVPIILGRQGVERIVELPLTGDERTRFNESLSAIRANIEEIPADLLK